jgi:ribosomal protein S18 acetylase RimI-like enzyme
MSSSNDDDSRPVETPAPGPIEIREMKIEDVPAVFALGEKLFPADGWPNLYRLWDEYQVIDLFASDGETCLVAEHENGIVGFALGTVIEKRRSAWTYGYLLWLGVDPSIGPRGVGSRLFNRIQELFEEHGVRMLLVDTAADNGAALAFFRKQGFGNEQGHVFLSKNLEAPKRRPRARRRPKRPARRELPVDAPPPSRRISVADDEE